MNKEAALAVKHGSDILSQYNRLNQLGALENLENLRKENKELDRLISDAAALVALPDVSMMLDFVIDKILERFVPEFLAFVMEPPRGTRLNQYCYRNLRLCDETIPIECYRRIKQHFLSKPFTAQFETIKNETGEYKELDRFSPEIVFPMRGISGLYGIVVLGSKVVGNEYSELERMYLDRLSRFLSVGIQNSFHHQSSITDPKTGLYNHDYFVRRLNEELARSGRQGTQACVFMLDVDHFKWFNDLHGHMAGDVALETLAEALKQATRIGDSVSRFGGEEFCVLAVDCNEASAIELAERIRQSIESMSIQYAGQSLSITVSIGSCMLDARVDAKQIIDNADKALYAAKSSGRNCCKLFRAGLLGRATLLRASMH
ncbi:MAG: GGDEF domain-containing protein [Spirochaetia bacterium]|nr:GGDEF domain-containing protein [Spirochaetia bacterium]